MTTWKDLLKNASIDQSLERARMGMGAKTTYVLGKGGFDPTKNLTQQCDCSGFVAWAIGIPREFPPGSGRWLDTDAYWNSGGSAAKAAGFPLLQHVPAADAQPGDLLVYPDQGGKQGHIGMISAVTDDGELKVIHCSKGNWKKFGDATLETDSAVWKIQPKTRVMRIDFNAMRLYSGVDTDTEPVIDALELAAESFLTHSLLASDPTLQLVAAGKLQLSRTGKRVSGIASVQQAMNILAREHAEYAIDLGVNEANAGIFGPRTERALQELQSDLGLTASGVLDVATLKGLDDLICRVSAQDDAGGEPAEDEAASPPPDVEVGSSPLTFELSRDGNAWFASTLDQRFYVGSRVRYQGRIGLMNTRANSGPVYDPRDYADTFKHWAYFIYPTAQAESRGRFNCLNTYDRAGFTFGFLQFAAHVANGDFVKFFRALLQLNERRAYFPELELENGHIVQRTASGLLRLENPQSSEALKRYLNPSGGEVEDREVLSAAKFIHWSTQSQAHRVTQVEIGIATAREKLRQAQKRMALNGRSDKVCFVVMDILHQGRGTYAVMKSIVENNNDAAAYEKLLTIGAAEYPGRIETIRAQVADLERAGRFGVKKYSAADNDLVD